MRLSALTLALALTLPAAAADPKAVVEKAVKAHGGAAKLDQYAAQKATLKGTFSAQGMDIELTGTFLRAYPDKEKLTATLNFGGQEVPLVQVVNGGKVKLSVGDMAQEVDGDRKADALLGSYATLLAGRLTPLLAAGGPFTLKPGPDAAVGGNPAVGVVVEHKEFKPVTLFFDKESGLLVKVVRPGKEVDGTDADRESVYGDYKAVNGVQLPHTIKTTLGGKKLTDFTVEKYELLEKVDDSEFAVD